MRKPVLPFVNKEWADQYAHLRDLIILNKVVISSHWLRVDVEQDV